ncbi:cryptococcal mannosyltransferase 1-domain-containing protein [Aspergillus pseudotamarii]|uniref:Cryptococcal mannosyltransferase 1-domain-containing protein n=1 Tax=Aspergillus pseudotamarii TaxID=132259 RepID=A0A5N6TB07_ASPPS|nr:cryptococcal mannosyltransferase 1-domain-containing protein [Aspergillus pseudotamarii]KAE8143492.1 cryptococcal mannosyltransferase 1-domain-containing protein [Aspergillus pseudotamarii]
MKPHRYSLYRKARRIRLALFFILVGWTIVEVLHIKYSLVRESQPRHVTLGSEKIYIAGLHWNSEQILREAWIAAVVDLANAIGRDNVFVSIQESGSWDDTKGALILMDQLLAENEIPRRIVLDNTTHLDEITKPLSSQGWIETPIGTTELRRIPYLAKLRNVVMEPLYEQNSAGIIYDKILFLNDVIFTTSDIQRLLSTRGGNYAATCALDFSKPPNFYDTFALRDSEGHDMLMQSWPYFRSRASRQALKGSQPVPVTSCWNGVVAMDATPFYQNPPLRFRGISDSLAKSHLEGSECCLIHADNPLSREKGVWLNPNVRVGYSSAAYLAVNPEKCSWLSSFTIGNGLWKNRFMRWLTTPWFKENIVWTRLWKWEKQSQENRERGPFCLINEMQVLTENGWAHR